MVCPSRGYHSYYVEQPGQRRKGICRWQSNGDQGWKWEGGWKCQTKKIPNINLETTTLRGLIDWEKEKLYEPILTCSLSLNELDGLRGTPFSCPYYCNHTQSTERAVQQVTQAAESVCGPEKERRICESKNWSRGDSFIFQKQKRHS